MVGSMASLERKEIPEYVLYFLICVCVFLSIRSLLFLPGPLNYGEWNGRYDHGRDFEASMDAWSSTRNLGYTNIGMPSSVATAYLLGFNSVLNMIFGDLAPIVLLVIVELVSILGMSSLFERLYPHAREWKLVAGLVFAFNPWLVSTYAAGHLTVVLSYSLTPLVVRAILIFSSALSDANSHGKGILRRVWNAKNAILLGGISMGLMFQFAVHFLVIVGIIACGIALRAMITSMHMKEGWRTWLRKGTSVFACLALLLTIMLLVNLHLILPYLIYREQIFSAYSIFSVQQLHYNSEPCTLLNVILLKSNRSYITYWSNVYTVPFITITYAILFSISVCLMRRRNAFWLSMLFVIGVFLSKGTNPPFGEIFEFLYVNVPFFSGFRDPAKSMIMVTMSYSIGIAFLLHFVSTRPWNVYRDSLLGQVLAYLRAHGTLKKLRARMRTFGVRNNHHIVSFRNGIKAHAKVTIIALFIAWLLCVNPVFFSGNFGGTATRAAVPEEYSAVDGTIERAGGSGRVVYLPTSTQGLGDFEWYPSSENPSYLPPMQNCYILSRPLAQPIPGILNRSAQLPNYATYHFMESGLSSELLNKTATDYIIVDGTLKPTSDEYYHALAYDRALSSSGRLKEERFGEVSLYDRNVEPGLAYASESAVLVVGDLSAIKRIYDISPELSKLPLLFSSTLEDFGVLSDGNVGIVFSEGNLTDLVADATSVQYRNYELDVAGSLTSNIDPWHQWIIYYPYVPEMVFEDGLIFKHELLAYTIGDTTATVPFEAQSGTYRVLLRVVQKPITRGFGYCESIVPKDGTIEPWGSFTEYNLSGGNYTLYLHLSSSEKADLEVTFWNGSAMKSAYGSSCGNWAKFENCSIPSKHNITVKLLNCSLPMVNIDRLVREWIPDGPSTLSVENTSIAVSVDGMNVGLANTLLDDFGSATRTKWVDVGTIVLSGGKHELELTSGSYSEKIIDSAIVCPDSIWQEQMGRYSELASNRSIVLSSSAKCALGLGELYEDSGQIMRSFNFLDGSSFLYTDSMTERFFNFSREGHDEMQNEIIAEWSFSPDVGRLDSIEMDVWNMHPWVTELNISLSCDGGDYVQVASEYNLSSRRYAFMSELDCSRISVRLWMNTSFWAPLEKVDFRISFSNITRARTLAGEPIDASMLVNALGVSTKTYDLPIDKCSETKYNAKLESDRRLFVVFRMTYSKYWLCNGKSGMHGDFYANCYFVSGGELEFVYQPSEVFKASMAVSMATMAICFAVIMFASMHHAYTSVNWSKRKTGAKVGR